MPVNTVFFIRHGENPANLTREFSYRRVDYPLTERGVRQAEQTAAYFAAGGADRRVDAIFSSPLKRALQTAEIIARATGHTVEVVEAFREINCGDLEGQPPTPEAWALHDDILARWEAGQHDIAFPGGEDYHTLLARARAGLEQVTRGREDQNIVIVTHGGIVTATLKSLCHALDLEAIRAVPKRNCAITEIALHGTEQGLRGMLRRWASADHLSD